MCVFIKCVATRNGVFMSLSCWQSAQGGYFASPPYQPAHQRRWRRDKFVRMNFKGETIAEKIAVLRSETSRGNGHKSLERKPSSRVPPTGRSTRGMRRNPSKSSFRQPRNLPKVTSSQDLNKKKVCRRGRAELCAVLTHVCDTHSIFLHRPFVRSGVQKLMATVRRCLPIVVDLLSVAVLHDEAH